MRTVMKMLMTILVFLFCLHVYGQEYYFVNAENGLNVRSEAGLSSEKVAKLPFGTMVTKIADTDVELIVEDNGKNLKGKWIKIKYNNYLYLVSEEKDQFEREGYVFDSYLKKRNREDLISTTQIEKSQYDELLKVAPKQIHKPKKVTNLDSIKVILKDKVTWFTEMNEYGYKREDALESIITDNGQKLIINQESNDYGFMEGSSGYYPEYGILALEGPHASDISFSIKTGETEFTIGNPKYILPSPKNTYRLNGYFSGQECVLYFFQKKEAGRFSYLTEYDDFDICTFKTFYWISETKFIYAQNVGNGMEDYFVGLIKQ